MILVGSADPADRDVSMKSGLEDRNNVTAIYFSIHNGKVSMKSGLEGRNNASLRHGRPSSGNESQ